MRRALGIIASHYTVAAVPLAVTLLTNGSSDTDLSSYPTASVSPVADSLVVVWSVASHGTLTCPTATPSGLGLTWTSRADNAFSGTTPVRRHQVWTAQCAASAPTPGVITFTCTGNTPSTALCWGALQVVGHDKAAPWVQQALTSNPGGSQTSSTVTLGAAPNAANLLLAFFTFRGGVAVTPRTNWTELSDGPVTTAPAGTHETQWRLGLEQTASCSWTGGITGQSGIVCEIKKAA